MTLRRECGETHVLAHVEPFHEGLSALVGWLVILLKSSSTVVARDEGFVGWLLNVPATYSCILGADLQRQVYVLPH